MDFSKEIGPTAEFPWLIIEKLRRMKGIPKKVLASKLRINYSYLVDLLNGRYPSKIDNQKLQSLSDVLHIPINELLRYLTNPGILAQAGLPVSVLPVGKTVKPKKSELVASSSTTVSRPADFQIPLIRHRSEDKIPDFAKFISPTEGRIIPERYRPKYWNNPDILAVRLEDDSMFPPFPQETIFMVDKKRTARLNDLVFMVIQDGRAWFREWYRTTESDEIILRSYNPRYDYLQILIKNIIAMYPMVGLEIKD